MLILALFLSTILKRSMGNKVENYKLLKAVDQLQIEVDGLTKELYTLKQQQADMLEQIKRLKEMNNDGSGK